MEPHYQRQKCSSWTLVSDYSDIHGGSCSGGLKRQSLPFSTIPLSDSGMVENGNFQHFSVPVAKVGYIFGFGIFTRQAILTLRATAGEPDHCTRLYIASLGCAARRRGCRGGQRKVKLKPGQSLLSDPSRYWKSA